MTAIAKWDAQPAGEELYDNASWAGAKPRLSILIPFLRDDPTRLLAALDHAGRDVELITLDDGTNDERLVARVAAAVQRLGTAARFVRLYRNEGRAGGRNRLARHARGTHFLFLDADMLPDHRAYVDVWLRAIAARDPAIAFGGLSVEPVVLERKDHAVARALAQSSDCRIALQRAKLPEKHVFTSNLLVRRDVFLSEAFDESFKGWGWEDVEWAVRVGRRHPIVHLDNPALHLGLDAPSVIATKYEQSAANFRRMLAAHGDVVRRYPIYRAARVLKRVPLVATWRPWLKAAALLDPLPVRLRAFALRLYRAALYAEAV